MASNYYDLLGVSENASHAEIREAYRDSVKEAHPDVSDHPDADKIFNQIKTGYDVLNHQNKRKRYDDLGHEHYIQKYGGISSKDLVDIHEQHLAVNQEKPTKRPNERQSSLTGPSNQQERLHGERATPNILIRFIQWIGEVYIQGRTSDRSGLAAGTLRLGALFVQLWIIITVISWIVGPPPAYSERSIADFAVALSIFAGVRLSYLMLFERLRDEYIKIDDSPKPDAYTLPYALVLFILAVVLIVFDTLGHNVFYPEFVSSVIKSTLLWIGSVLYIISAFGIALGVGWGVADDYYNLKLDVNPIYWNFFVQVPIVLPVTYDYLPRIEFGYDSMIFLTLLFAPFITGSVYLIKHHSEVFETIWWKYW